MTASTPHDESVVAAMCAALERYPWRRLTPGLFAEIGTWESLEPVHLEDDRVDRLVDFLAGQRWTDQPLSVVCGQLHGALKA